MSGNLYGVKGENLGPVSLGTPDVDLDRRRRTVKVKHDLLGGLVIVQSPLDNLADTLDPLLHRLAGDRVEKRGEAVEEVAVFGEVVEMLDNKDGILKKIGGIILVRKTADLVNPVLEDVENSELNRL